MSDSPEFPELGFYGLAGHSENPGDLVDEVRQAEELGLGSVFLSERFNYKDAAVMSGMAAAASTADRHRHRGDEPQHPAPAGHRDHGGDRCTGRPAAVSRSASAAGSRRSST